MLNTDLELIVDFDVNGVEGRICDPGTESTVCKPANTKSLVETFSMVS